MHTCSVLSDSATPRIVVAHEATLSMGFPRQKYWRGLPFPSPGAFPDPGIESLSLASPALAGRFFTTCAIWEAHSPHGHKESDMTWQLNNNVNEHMITCQE